MIIAYLRRFAACLALFASTLPAFATSTGIDYTDQWWGGPSESGWGVNFIEQGTTIFATLFVYGADQKPTWFVATMDPTSGTNPAFTGILYATTGPAFNGPPFNTNNVTVSAVGTMTIVFSSAYAGSLNYIVNGVSVNKAIVRQSFKNNNLSGTYMGGLAATASNCKSNVPNGATFMDGGIVVTQNAQAVSMAVNFSSNSGDTVVCTFNGTLGAQGVMGQIQNGTFSCVDQTTGNSTGNAGTFNLDNMTMMVTGFSGVFTGSDQFCTYNGFFGGLKEPG